MLPLLSSYFQFWRLQPAHLPVYLLSRLFIVWAASPLNLPPSFCWYWIFEMILCSLCFLFTWSGKAILSLELGQESPCNLYNINVQTFKRREILIQPLWDATDMKASGYDSRQLVMYLLFSLSLSASLRYAVNIILNACMYDKPWP